MAQIVNLGSTISESGKKEARTPDHLTAPATYWANPSPGVRVTPLLSWLAALLVRLLLALILPASALADGRSLVSVDVMSQDIRVVLKDLATQAGVNVSVDDSIQRRVTLHLNNVSFEDVLRIFASSMNFEVSDDAGVFLIRQRDDNDAQMPDGALTAGSDDAETSLVLEIGSMDPQIISRVVKAIGSRLVPTPFTELGIVVVNGPYAEINSARTALSSWLSKPVQIPEDQYADVVHVNYLDVQDTLNALSSQFSGVRVAGVRNTNAIMVFGKKADVEKTAALIRSLDVPPKVVSIDVEIVEVLHDDRSNVGVEWKGTLGEPGFTIGWQEADPPSGPRTSEGGGVDDSTFQISFRPWVRASLSFTTNINLLVENGKAKVLARPSITTVENRAAKIMTGDRYTIVLAYSQGSTTWQQIQYLEAGVQLEITPRVDERGEITAELFPQVSAITGFTKEGYPRMATREARTTVRVKDGETIAIGGLLEKHEIQRDYGLLFLGKLPILGNLFSNAKDSNETTELVILVTLRVLNGATQKGSAANLQARE